MRRDLIIGLLVSLAAHGGLAYFGDLYAHRTKAPPPKEEVVKMELIQMPKIEPDEQPTVDETNQAPPQDFAPPMQTDVPTMVPDTSFIQPPHVPPPDIAVNKSQLVVPQNTGNWAKGIGKIFDISQLDQIPSAIPPQVRPQYPFEMRRAGISGEVTVEFIVNTNGSVVNAFAAKSTQREFEQAAVAAVSKWRFKPGRKGGRDVPTRMQIPIQFTLNADNE